jgi:hypothetical protein
MIQDLLDEDCAAEDPSLPLLKSLDRSFKACKSTVENVDEQLGVELSGEPDSETVKISFKKRATWPWKEREVSQSLQSIEKFKTIFILALDGKTLQVGRTIQESVTNVSESIQKMDRHRSILDWFQSSDPSVNHNEARKKHEPTTGDWLLKSELFTYWAKGTKTSLPMASRKARSWKIDSLFDYH